MPSINTKLLNEVPISFPSLSEQKKIAAVLSSLDEKIETNRKISARLEELAQAIFKSWFIDFEPFGGKMPEDWEQGSAESFFQINIGKTPPRKEAHWFSKDSKDITWISIADMGKSTIFLNDSSEYLKDEAVNQYNVIVVPRDTILLSFKLTVGRVAIAAKNLTTNEAIARFHITHKDEREYLYLYLKNYDYNSLGSTSSIATAVNSKIIKNMPVIMPRKDVIANFSKLTRTLFSRIENLERESTRLAELRDTLLPKLMSGEIKVE